MTDEIEEGLLAQRERKIHELKVEVAKFKTERDELAEEVERLADANVKFTEQVEELSLSPLDMTQQQRAKALTLARDVVEETGSTHAFSKAASSRVSLAGVLSTAHFILTGERDYVTGDGEYVLESDHRPADNTPIVRELLDEARAVRKATANHVGWQSGIEDTLDWITEHVSADAEIEMEDGADLDRDALIETIKDFFAEPNKENSNDDDD